MIRVLLAEKSNETREALAAFLRSDPEFSLLAETTDGLRAVALARTLKPSLVIVGSRLSRLNGFEATKEIMTEAPAPIVVVAERPGAEDVEASIRALRMGALAVMSGPFASEEDRVRTLAKLRAMAGVKVVRRWRERLRAAPAGPPPALVSGAPPRLVAVAASTGGPAALQTIFSTLPGNFTAPILAVQHIAPGFIEGLVAWLNADCALRVKIAEHGEALRPRTIYFAPDNVHLALEDRAAIALVRGAPVLGFRPSANVLFESVAKTFGSEALNLILTGMGQDGVEGLRKARAAGARVIAQDEASSIVFGMPQAAIKAGLASQVLALSRIAAGLAHFANVPEGIGS